MLRKVAIACICVFFITLSGCAQWFALPEPVFAPETAAPVPTSADETAKQEASPSPPSKNADAAVPSPSPSSFEPLPTDSLAPVTIQPETYIVRCDEYLTLRGAPSADSAALGRVKKGAKLEADAYAGFFAHVEDAAGNRGYVLAGYLVPEKKDKWLSGLDVVKPVEPYSYEQMTKDLEKLASLYPGKLRIESAGKSLEGRDIPVAVLGDPDAPRQVFIQGTVHAREYMASLLIMAQLEYCLKYPDAPAPGGTVGQCLEGVCIRMLPMANPDGVEISQSAAMTAGLQAIYGQDQKAGLTELSAGDYLKTWKANAAGVDINRNFPSGWEALDTTAGPSASRYRGEAPGDQPETQALMGYTQGHRFDATVSYHASGCCIYWQYGANEAVNSASHSLAAAAYACTGYPLEGDEGLDAGGYKDWAIDALGIPSLTIEIGGRDCPMPLDEFYTTWERNRNVPVAVAEWVKNR